MLQIKSAQSYHDFQDARIRRTLGNLGEVLYSAKTAIQIINNVRESDQDLSISLEELCKKSPDLVYLLRNALGESYI